MLASVIEKNDQLNNFITNEDIIQTFNPSAAPYFGCIWEFNVKRVKFHLKRETKPTVLSYKEFISLLIQVEEYLKFRFSCATSSDQNDFQTLTP